MEPHLIDEAMIRISHGRQERLDAPFVGLSAARTCTNHLDADSAKRRLVCTVFASSERGPLLKGRRITP